MCFGQRRSGSRWAAGRLTLLAVTVSVLSACGLEDEKVALCARLISAFEDDGARATIERVMPHPKTENAIILDYRLPDEQEQVSHSESEADGVEDAPHWVSCAFETERTGWLHREVRLVQVANDRSGKLSDIELHMLKIWLKVGPGWHGDSQPVSQRQPNPSPH